MSKAAAPLCNPADQIDWNDIRYALLLARHGNLAAAARALGVAATTVSRRLQLLEARIGTPLFERFRGQMTLTATGSQLVERGARIEQEIAAIAQLSADHQAAVRGLTRITAVDAIVSHYLARHVDGLRARYPELAVELIGSSRTLDLGRREADLAIRLARPESGDLVLRRLGTLGYGIYAAHAAGPVTDWIGQSWVAYENALAHVPEMRWLAERVAADRVVFRCNNIDALATAVAAGLGLGILPGLVGRSHPGLRCLSGDSPVLSRDIWLVVPRELRDVPRVRAVADWVVECFADDAGLLSGATG